MNEIVEGFKRPGERVSWDSLLVSLRDELRRELELEPIEGLAWWLKFPRSTDNIVPNQSTDPTPASVTPVAGQPARQP
jgi:hypothetical protein